MYYTDLHSVDFDISYFTIRHYIYINVCEDAQMILCVCVMSVDMGVRQCIYVYFLQ